MKLLITGSQGQVGRALCSFALEQDIDYQAFSSEELDIRKESKVLRTIRKAKPSFVINAAAYTAVDQAEQERDSCFAVNAVGVHNLAIACKRLSIPLMHLSTDYIFDGQKRAAYAEDDEPHPISVYGESKLEGERLLTSVLEKYVILRVSWVFSEWGSNFVKTMTRLAGEKEMLKVVDDQIGAPTPANDIARVIIAMIRQLECGADAWGCYHYSGREVSNWYELACQVVEQARLYREVTVKQIETQKTKEYGYIAARPLNSQLNCQKILEVFGIKQRSWKPEMARVVKECAPKGVISRL